MLNANMNTLLKNKLTQTQYVEVMKYLHIKQNIERSPLYLAKVCGFDRFVDQAYQEWESELLHPAKRKLFLKPRGTFKSTLYTVIYPVWRLLLDPNLRIKIVAIDIPEAREFLGQIRQIFLNPIIKAIYGDILIQKHEGAEKLNLKTRTDYSRRGFNISIASMKKSITGAHCDIMIIDDPCDEHDTFQATQRKKKIRVWEQNFKVLDNYPVGEMLIIGTRKHKEELYGHIIDTINPQLPEDEKWLIKTETPYNEDSSLRFPTYLGHKQIENEKINMGTTTFAHEMMNEPLNEGELIFFESDFEAHYFNYRQLQAQLLEERRKDFKLYLYIDLAISETKHADYTALALGAYEKQTIQRKPSNILHLMEGIKIKGNPTKIYQHILLLYDKWMNHIYKSSIDIIGIEANGFQATWIDGLGRYCYDNGYMDIRISEINNMRNKQARIISIQPKIQNGLFRICSEWRKHYGNFIDDVLLFPTLEHDDAPDAMTGLIQMSNQDITNIIRTIK